MRVGNIPKRPPKATRTSTDYPQALRLQHLGRPAHHSYMYILNMLISPKAQEVGGKGPRGSMPTLVGSIGSENLQTWIALQLGRRSPDARRLKQEARTNQD
jgi:hypothetical protein